MRTKSLVGYGMYASHRSGNGVKAVEREKHRRDGVPQRGMKWLFYYWTMTLYLRYLLSFPDGHYPTFLFLYCIVLQITDSRAYIVRVTPDFNRKNSFSYISGLFSLEQGS